MASFWKPEACGQTELPDRSLLIGQKLVENTKMPKIQMRHFGWFSNTVKLVISRDLTVNSSIFFSPNYKGNEKRGEVIITLDFHFGWKKCTDASASSSSVERCRHKRSLDPFIFTSFSSPNILFQSVCWTLKEDFFLGEEKMHFLLQFCGVVTQNFK